MKNKIYVTNSFDIMEVDGIYDIRSISDKEIAELAKEYEFVNRGDGWAYVNTETGEVVYVNIPTRPIPEPLDLSKEVFCKILFVQESGSKLIEYATVTGETPACIYFP
jgi:hypothetical protein